MTNSDGINTLSKLSGINKTEMLEIWEKVKENKKKLDSCERPHDFSIDLDPKKPMNKRWECTKCGGYVDGINKKWYEEGLNDKRNE